MEESLPLDESSKSYFNNWLMDKKKWCASLSEEETNVLEKKEDIPKVNLSFESAYFTITIFNTYYLYKSTQYSFVYLKSLNRVSLKQLRNRTVFRDMM